MQSRLEKRFAMAQPNCKTSFSQRRRKYDAQRQRAVTRVEIEYCVGGEKRRLVSSAKYLDRAAVLSAEKILRNHSKCLRSIRSENNFFSRREL